MTIAKNAEQTVKKINTVKQFFFHLNFKSVVLAGKHWLSRLDWKRYINYKADYEALVLNSNLFSSLFFSLKLE